jgi:ribose/xylose/arabinose/galactoside ABC-type transport system permease subunit
VPSNSAVPRGLAGRVFRFDEFGVIAALLALVLVTGLSTPPSRRWGQLVDVVEQAAFVGILACGMTYLLAMRELDLSVGSTQTNHKHVTDKTFRSDATKTLNSGRRDCS